MVEFLPKGKNRILSGASATRSTCFIIFYLLSFILIKTALPAKQCRFSALWPSRRCGPDLAGSWGRGCPAGRRRRPACDDLLGRIAGAQVFKALVAVPLGEAAAVTGQQQRQMVKLRGAQAQLAVKPELARVLDKRSLPRTTS